ncbi:hypothetical protein AM274_30495 [Pseudomonas nunensis]|nr:hypothetical protein AM274_30495 [Pseudomonas nunensis]
MIFFVTFVSSGFVYAGSDSYKSKEKVETDLVISEPQNFSDEDYQRIILNTLNPGVGFCEDSFGRAFVRKIFGASKKSILTVTVNKIPYISFTYDQKTKKCSKAYSIETNLTSYELARNANKEFKINLIYSDEAEITVIQDLYDAGKSVAKFASGPVLNPEALQFVETLTKKFDKAVAEAINSTDLHDVSFVLPDSGKNTKFQLTAKIADKQYDVLSMRVEKQGSRLLGKTARSVMDTTLTGDKISAQKVVADYRVGPGAAISGEASKLEGECNKLEGSFSSILNDKDIRVLLESHLSLNYSAEKQNQKNLKACLGDADYWKVVNLDLKENIIRNPPIFDSKRDAGFLSKLNQGGYERVTDASTKYFDKNGLLSAKTVSELVALPGVSNAACYQFVGVSVVDFVMFDTKSGKTLFFEAEIDQEYSESEYKSGKFSIIKSLLVDSVGSSEYLKGEDIRGCIVERRIARGLSTVAAEG